MTVSTINSSVDAADAYLAATTERARDVCLQAVQEWLAAEYEQDGYGEQIDGMDLTGAALALIERRRTDRR